MNDGSITFSGATPAENLNQPVLRPGMSNTAVISATSNCGSSLPSRLVYQRPAFALYETNTLKSPPDDGGVMKPMILFPLLSVSRIQAGGIAFGGQAPDFFGSRAGAGVVPVKAVEVR